MTADALSNSKNFSKMNFKNQPTVIKLQQRKQLAAKQALINKKYKVNLVKPNTLKLTQT
jgi:hypothetical protein